jgi:hypothetical protein
MKVRARISHSVTSSFGETMLGLEKEKGKEFFICPKEEQESYL